MSNLFPTYSRYDIKPVEGKGSYITDDKGDKYLDYIAGIAVLNLGHCPANVEAAVIDQVKTLWHMSNLFPSDVQDSVASQLTGAAHFTRVFFCNSGAEANEGAIKLARLYGQQQGKANAKIIVMSEAFHGRTLATLTATGNVKVQKGFEPLVTGFVRVPFNDVAAIRALQGDNDVVAVMLEVIQGEGGLSALSQGALTEIRAICDENQWLLMLDEVQTGVGRTGQWFAHQIEGVKPDVMTLAKGLGSGVPVGALLTAGRATGVFHVGAHGTTFGGNPLAMCAGLTTLDVIETDGLLDNARQQGQAIREGLAQALSAQVAAGTVKSFRGVGLMIGIELDRPCAELVKRALDAGLLINVTHDTVVRLLPPLVINDADSAELVSRLAAVIKEFLS